MEGLFVFPDESVVDLCADVSNANVDSSRSWGNSGRVIGECAIIDFSDIYAKCITFAVFSNL